MLIAYVRKIASRPEYYWCPISLNLSNKKAGQHADENSDAQRGQEIEASGDDAEISAQASNVGFGGQVLRLFPADDQFGHALGTLSVDACLNQGVVKLKGSVRHKFGD